MKRNLALGLFLVCCALPAPASAQYRLDSGDVLDVAVFGRADLSRRINVDVDGNVSVPLAGEIHAAGMSLTELRAKIKGLLSTNDLVRPADVIVDLVEYRPFYIDGDVAKGGAYPYRPNLTVRQALALAGGIDAARQRANVSPLQGAELRGRYNALLVEAAKQQVRVNSLRAELEGKAEVKLPALPSPGSKEFLAEVAQLEQQSLKARQLALAQEQEHLKRAISLADDNVTALDRGQQQDQEATRQQSDELAKIVDLNRRGLAAPGRVSEEQRATILMKSREMDTSSRLAGARQEREELLRKMEKADDRQTRVTRELQDAITTLQGLYAQLDALREQLVLTGSVGAQAADGEQKPPEISIVRRQGNARVSLAANEDTEVQPDDVIQFKVNFDWMSPALGN